jgi:hypothetical protein
MADNLRGSPPAEQSQIADEPIRCVHAFAIIA